MFPASTFRSPDPPPPGNPSEVSREQARPSLPLALCRIAVDVFEQICNRTAARRLQTFAFHTDPLGGAVEHATVIINLEGPFLA